MKISNDQGRGFSTWTYKARHGSPEPLSNPKPLPSFVHAPATRSNRAAPPDSKVPPLAPKPLEPLHKSPIKNAKSRIRTPETSPNSLEFSLEGLRIGTLEPALRTKSLSKSPPKPHSHHLCPTCESSPCKCLQVIHQLSPPAADWAPRSFDSPVILLAPQFKGRSPTVVFDYPPQCMLPSRVSPHCYSMDPEELTAKPLFFRISKSIHTYNAVTNSFAHAGFEETKGKHYNAYISAVPKPEYLREMQPNQKLSHFPGIYQLGWKSLMWKNVYAQRRKFGPDYEICPTTYLLPQDFKRLQAKREEDPKGLWILKPANSSCGRGIRVINGSSQLSNKQGYVVSKYIADPHTLNGFKYDLRLYVCVTSFDPLRVYLYRDGLVRFATEAYTLKKLKKKYVHLTNFSINKRSAKYVRNSDAQIDGEGNKWSLKALQAAFERLGINYESVFKDIEDVIIKTLISVEPHVVNALNQANRANDLCFETYGFDILLDSALKPWLLEVNICPSLSSSSPIDKRIKTSLMCDVLTLVGIVPTERKAQSRLPGSERPKAAHRNLNALQASGTIDGLELSQEDLMMLADYEEEGGRTGQFRRVFPVKGNHEKYSEYFQMKRYNNLLLWKHIANGGAALERLLQRQRPRGEAI